MIGARIATAILPAFSLRSASGPIRTARQHEWPRRILSARLDESGAVAFVFALMATGLIAILGLGVDIGAWHRIDRTLQNAADAAAVAAARNGTSSYQSEAKAVAAQYGLVDGAGGVTVTALNNQTCPNGQTDCYSVSIAMAAAPQFFSQVVRMPAPALSSSAMAGGGQTHSYCLIALSSSGTDPAITTNGSPKADLSGCGIMSNTGADCHGHDLKADYGDAHKWRCSQDRLWLWCDPKQQCSARCGSLQIACRQYTFRYLRRLLSTGADEEERLASAGLQPMD